MKIERWLPFALLAMTCLPIAGIFAAVWIYGSVQAIEPYWYIRLPELLIYLAAGVYGAVRFWQRSSRV